MKAVVIKKEKDKAYLLTADGQFIASKKFKDAEIGETVEILHKNFFSHPAAKILIAASVIIALLVSVLTFRAPEVYAYVYIEINPSIKAAVDKNGKVISAISMNEEAKKILEKIPYKGLDISTFIVKTVEESEKMGFLRKDGEVIITTIPLKESKIVEEKVQEAVENIKKSKSALKFEVNAKEEKVQRAEEKRIDAKQDKTPKTKPPVKITNTEPKNEVTKDKQEKQKIKVEVPVKITKPDKEVQKETTEKPKEENSEKQEKSEMKDNDSKNGKNEKGERDNKN
ncbi:anti-sigma factor domain-containing protein [Caldanaerobacter subterraneus]|uniref:Anti-sigma factor domain-containing protein n=1 Tax=Caldanaerobacter subterraneus TaxID=911092 RepID=A0A7Y2L6B0_9THEO|nr:anti-sigma factor domain-containing protein [Caldanaerobacter subterraneus]NNG66559.1 anti-sigma factor domain-containing protein [Caldanaerobacter subterraneus]